MAFLPVLLGTLFSCSHPAFTCFNEVRFLPAALVVTPAPDMHLCDRSPCALYNSSLLQVTLEYTSPCVFLQKHLICT